MKNIWGLSIEIIEELGNDLVAFYDQFKQFFQTRTRDVSHHGLTWFKASLLLEGKRTYMEVSRKLVDPSAGFSFGDADKHPGDRTRHQTSCEPDNVHKKSVKGD